MSQSALSDHYAQVEGTFLKAKLDLQKARETQDLLAEHLNIIIVNNEDRKANKLADLMAKVGLGRNGETMVDAFVQRCGTLSNSLRVCVWRDRGLTYLNNIKVSN